MDIGLVSKISGLPTSTIRHYEKKGLIHSIGRHGLRRQFGENIINQLAVISLGRAVGFSLDELSHVFDKDGLTLNRELLARKVAELDKQISELKTKRAGLQHAIQCTAESHMECATFQRYMGIAAKIRNGTKGRVA